MLARLTAVVVALAAIVGLCGTTPAQAAWNTLGTGPSRQASAVMPVGPQPAVTRNYQLGVGYVYTLTWPRSQIRGTSVTGYFVSRSVGGAILGVGTCTGVTVLGFGPRLYFPDRAGDVIDSCTDISAVVLTGVSYTITPVYGNWVGVSSTWSLPA